MDEDKIINECQALSWSNCDATTFKVRVGPDYVAGSGQKSPSKKALYNVFAMDAYKLPRKINKIFKYMNIDKYVDKYRLYAPYDKEKCPLPPLFILNVMVPNYTPELMGGKSDGEGYQMILYAHLSQEIANQLQQNKLSPAVKLFKDFIHSDLVNSELRNRFKCIARIMNPNHTDFGFLANRLVKRYNGKPFLARTSSTFYHEAGKYFAADIDAHVFGYPARQGLSYVKDTIQTAIYDVGFVVEGHTNDQLPEQIVACCRMSKIGVDLCKEFPIKPDMHKEQKHDDDDDDDDDQHQHIEKNTEKSQSNQLLLNHNDKKRNGDIISSKSTTSLQKTHQNNSSWGWGYFG